MATRGRPKSVLRGALATDALLVLPDVLKRLRIHQDYVQFVVIIDVSDIVPFYFYRNVEGIFPNIGLVIKRKFGYLGYSWGYGEVKELREGENAPILEAPVSLHIYFQDMINEDFLIANAVKFEDIVKYLKKEMDIYKGAVVEEF
jgi:hypothetical protein